MDLHVMRSPESENHVFMFLAVSLCVFVISINKKTKLRQKIQICYSTFVLYVEAFHEDRL